MTDPTQEGPTGAPWPFTGLHLGAYTIVVIDVAWAWATWSEKGAQKSPSTKYQTMTMEEAGALPVRALLRPEGGVVLAWATWPLFNRQLAMFERDWGLTYKTGGGWAKRTASGKLRWGPGHIFRTVHEPFVLLTTGEAGPRGPGIKNLIETFGGKSIDGLAREHSRKPDEFYNNIDRMVPVGRRVDVFSRQDRQGWDTFGYEAGKWR